MIVYLLFIITLKYVICDDYEARKSEYDKRFVGNSLRVILKRFRKNKKR